MLMYSPVIWARCFDADEINSPELFHNSKLAVIAAQKRSAEFALSTLQLDHERQVKEFKSEKRELESEVSVLLRNRAVLNTKAELPEEEGKNSQLGSDQFPGKAVERLDQVVKACNAVESSMLSELERLRKEAISNRHCQMELERANAESSAKIGELNTLLEARSRRLKELEAFVEEKKNDLAEYGRLKLRSEQLEMKTKNLEDCLKLKENRISTSKGIGYLARLELEYERLKTTYKNLSKERAEWLITKEENNELINQVEHLKNWRQRALNAENALTEMQSLEISFQSSPLVSASRVSVTRLCHLERENELLLAEHGRLRSEITDLQMKLNERPTVQEVLPQPLSTPHSWTHTQPAYIPIDKTPSSCELEPMIALRRRITELETQLSQLQEKPENMEVKDASSLQTVKVLTFEANPMAKIQASLSNEVFHLRQENERFRQRIKVLEDSISRLNRMHKSPEDADEPVSGVHSVTMVVNQRLRDNPDPLTELEEVREQLRVERLRSDRLMEMFDKASSKFRGACRDLLGYRVDVNPSDEYKVRSVFSSSPHEFIQFRRINGKFELKDTEYTLGLPSHVRSFLTTNQSIPGFFAALTSTYLQQETMIL